MRLFAALLLGTALSLAGCSGTDSSSAGDPTADASRQLDAACVNTYEPYFAYAHMNLNQGIRSLLNDESAGFDSSLGASVATAAVRMTSASLAAGASQASSCVTPEVAAFNKGVADLANSSTVTLAQVQSLAPLGQSAADSLGLALEFPSDGDDPTWQTGPAPPRPPGVQANTLPGDDDVVRTLIEALNS